MNPQQTQQPAGQTRPAGTTVTRPTGGGAGGGKSDFERLLEEKVMVYSPFGAPEKDTIKLTPKIVMDLIAVPTKTGKTCSERDAIRFMMMCKARRLNPFEGDAYLIGYDGQGGPQFSLITAHQAFLKRAEVHAEYDGMRSGIILLDGGELVEREGDFHLSGEQVVGGWATVYFKNRSHPTTRKIRLERFNTGRAQWGVDPAGMIVKCAEADSLRSSFPTLVGGLYLDGEIDMDFGDVAKLNTSRPLFSDKTSATAAETKAKVKGKPDPRKEPGPEASQAEPETQQTQPEPNEPRFEESEQQQDRQQEPEQPKPVKMLRNHCKIANIKEGRLLDWWSETGATGGDVSSFEEVAMQHPALVQQTLENWPSVVEKIKSGQGGAS